MFKNKIIASFFTFGALSLSQLGADKPTLTVYTYDSFAAEWGPGPQIKKNFEAQCGVN